MAENETIRQEGKAAGVYRAFLLRCWQENGDGEPLWRFTLVKMGNDHSKKGFARLEDLTTFLREELSLCQPDKDQGR
jgi:hypothetical protein